MLPTRSDRVSSFLRCFAVQGSWNYRSLVAGGLANAMLPLLRRVYAGDPAGLRTAVERHLKPFNGHPYLLPMAVTSLARLEHEGVPAEKIDRFRTALRAPLGALGDELVWATWRPVCALLAIALFWIDRRPWLAIGLFLLLYNTGHLALRAWAFRRGWIAGLSVGEELGAPPWGRVVPRLGELGLLLAGAVVGLVVWMAAPALVARWVAAPALAGALLLGYARPVLGERLAAALVVVAPIALALLGG